MIIDERPIERRNRVDARIPTCRCVEKSIAEPGATKGLAGVSPFAINTILLVPPIAYQKPQNCPEKRNGRKITGAKQSILAARCCSKCHSVQNSRQNSGFRAQSDVCTRLPLEHAFSDVFKLGGNGSC